MLATQLALAPMRRQAAARSSTSPPPRAWAEPYRSPEYGAAKAGLSGSPRPWRALDGVRVELHRPGLDRDRAAHGRGAASIPPPVPLATVTDAVLRLIRDDTLAGVALVLFARRTAPPDFVQETCRDQPLRHRPRRMNTGELYVDYGEGLEELEAERTRGKELLYDFNHGRRAAAERLRLLRALLGAVGEGVWIEPPFFASYGSAHPYRRRVLRELQPDHRRRRRRAHRRPCHVRPNVTITTTGTLSSRALPARTARSTRSRAPRGRRWVGANVAIMPGVRIGAGP